MNRLPPQPGERISRETRIRFTFDGKQVLCAPRQAVKWTAILSRGNLAIGFLRLCAGSIFGESDDELQHGIVLLESAKIHVGECN